MVEFGVALWEIVKFTVTYVQAFGVSGALSVAVTMLPLVLTVMMLGHPLAELSVSVAGKVSRMTTEFAGSVVLPVLQN
jgi:hypothetical protein